MNRPEQPYTPANLAMVCDGRTFNEVAAEVIGDRHDPSIRPQLDRLPPEPATMLAYSLHQQAGIAESRIAQHSRPGFLRLRRPLASDFVSRHLTDALNFTTKALAWELSEAQVRGR